MLILGLTIPSAYWASPNLVFFGDFPDHPKPRSWLFPIAGFGFSWWGITECAVLGNIERGIEFGRLGIFWPPGMVCGASIQVLLGLVDTKLQAPDSRVHSRAG